MREVTTGTLTFQLDASGTEITQFSGFEKDVDNTEGGGFGGGYETEIAGAGLPVHLEARRPIAEERGESPCSEVTKRANRWYNMDWKMYSELQGYGCDTNSYVPVSCE